MNLKKAIPTLVIFVSLSFSFKRCQSEFPKRINDRIYTTYSTFYWMDGNDTITNLLNNNTLKLAE